MNPARLAGCLCCLSVAAAGCGGGDEAAEAARAATALEQAVLASRLAEIDAATELEQDYPRAWPADESGAERASGLLTALRVEVASLHEQLELATVEVARRELEGELRNLRAGRRLLNDDIRDLQAQLESLPAPAPGAEPRLIARHQAVAAAVAARRAERAAALAHGAAAEPLTAGDVRALAGHLRGVARVVGNAYGPAGAALGVDRDAVLQLAEELERLVAGAGVPDTAPPDTPLPPAARDPVHARCRDVAPRIDAWAKAGRALPRRRARALVAEAAGPAGWLRTAPDRGRARDTCLLLAGLLAATGDAGGAASAVALGDALPADVLAQGDAAALADALAGLAPPEDGPR